MSKITRTIRPTSPFWSRPLAGLLFATAAAVAALSSGHPAAQQLPRAATAPVNFDIRDGGNADSKRYVDRLAAPAARVADLTAALTAGAADLRAAFAGIEIVSNPLLGTPEVVGVRAETGFLTGPTSNRAEAMRGFLSAHATAYGVSASEVASLDVVADYVNPAGNMAWVEFEQRINGVPVFQGTIRGGFTARGELARTTGLLASGLDGVQLADSPALSAAQAVSRAASNVGWNVAESALVQKGADGGKFTFARGTMADDAQAWLVYFPVAPAVARLAWATQIWGDPEAFLILTDAADGTILFRKNLTEYQTQSASYTIYNDDSPAPMSPSTVLPGSGTQAGFISRTAVTLIGNEAPNTFNNLGWMTDGANSTDGNNVEAGLDRDGSNGVDATVAGAARVFDFSYDPQADEPLAGYPVPPGAYVINNYGKGEVTDTFYWTNRYHDWLYLLGFTEPARNFQNNNFGRGGVAADRVSAESQDSSGTTNANFSTPVDGGRGRMQMYTFPGPTPDRSSGLDHDVLLHELTHGTSNRLHSNASGLTSDMSRGMGEGWSDFYARALLSTASEDPNGIYSTGGWVTNQIDAGFTDNYYYGIRRFPYASISTLGTNGKPHNPLTFADIDPSQANLTDGAYSPAFTGRAFEVHNVGEVWASVLFEVRARFITRLGFATGNQRVLQFITDGMKLDPANPTFLNARDSIIAAANASAESPAEKAADIADIWAGFAARGMGVNASVILAAGGVVSESFATPGSSGAPSFSISDATISEGNAGTKTLTFTVTRTNPVGPSRVSYVTADTTATGTNRTITSAPGISIPFGAAPAVSSPYPSSIVVSGVSGTLTDLNVRLNAVTHTWLADVDVLLVGPGGQSVVLMSDAGTELGNGSAVSGLNLTFDDAAPNSLLASTPISGTYKPTNIAGDGTDTFPVPAPAPAYGTTLAPFNSTDPNGTWSLYVVDDFNGDVGGITGFSLIMTTTAAVSSDYTGTEGQLVFPPGVTTRTINVTASGDATAEADETFNVSLFAPLNGTISRATGVGYILNDDGGGTPPTVVTNAAASVGAVTASLYGTFNPNGIATQGYYEYGLDTSYGRQTPPVSVGSGSGPVPSVEILTGLKCNTTYHYRAVGVNAGGATNGVDVTFKTKPCFGDIDGDGQSERTLWRPSSGVWYTLNSTGGATGTGWGLPTDIDVMADYDGDGKADIAVWRPSTGQWYIIQSATSTVRGDNWGVSGDIPLAGDVDGDGQADLVIWRPSTGVWYAKKSTGGIIASTWGVTGDTPLLGDFDGDGKSDFAVYRPGAAAVWYVALQAGGYQGIGWGVSGDIPVQGDWDGDGKADAGIFRPSTGQWFVLKSSGGGIGVGWGAAGDVPLSGDHDGDGKSDYILWRPSTGVWYTQFGVGGAAAVVWGTAGDNPVGRVPGS